MKYWYLLLFPIWISTKICAQDLSVPVMEREITINAKDEPLQVVLAAISRQGNFVFSYNPEAINANRNVSLNVSQKSVRQTLNMLFNGSVAYKARGKYIILQKNENTDIARKERVVEGYVYDSKSGKKLTETSVYDKNLLISAVTDKYGYFKLKLPAGEPRTALHISKEGYVDTMLTPLPGKANYVNIELLLKTPGIDGLKPSTIADTETKKHNRLPQWLLPNKIKINTRNLTDTVFKKVQFSLLPFVSTNKLLTGSVVNNVSINLTVGYVQGVRTIEFGGVLNIVRDDAGVCQLAGVGNIVGRSFHGFQGAGVWNATKAMKGIQAAGALNIVWNDASVCQLAGVGNIVGGAFEGIQAAGAFNIADDVKGYQVAGAVNISRKVTGIQMAGALNNAKEVSGGQISGFLNRAKVLKGFQLSIFNMADSCDGTPIGFLSYVKKGYHKIEISADEVFYTNLVFLTGVKHFHNILKIGLRPDNVGNPLWTYGYGLGTTFGNPAKLLFDIDIINQQIIRGSDINEKNSLYKIYIGIDKKLTPGTSIAFGITYNFFSTDTKSINYNKNYTDIIPYTFSDKTFSSGMNLKTWPGVKIGIRF